MAGFLFCGIVISSCAGPRGDGYDPGRAMSAASRLPDATSRPRRSRTLAGMQHAHACDCLFHGRGRDRRRAWAAGRTTRSGCGSQPTTALSARPRAREPGAIGWILALLTPRAGAFRRLLRREPAGPRNKSDCRQVYASDEKSMRRVNRVTRKTARACKSWSKQGRRGYERSRAGFPADRRCL
jgi:hypothetical protein